MNKIEIDVITGEQKVIELTAEEIAQAQAQYAEWIASGPHIKAEVPALTGEQ